MLLNKSFEIHRRPVVLPYHVGCTIRRQWNELFEFCVFISQAVEDEKCQVFAWRYFAWRDEEGKFTHFVFKRESCNAWEKMFVAKQCRVDRDWKEQALFHIRLAEQVLSVGVLDWLSSAGVIAGKNPPWYFSTFWRDEDQHVFQKIDKEVVLIFAERQVWRELSEK